MFQSENVFTWHCCGILSPSHVCRIGKEAEAPEQNFYFVVFIPPLGEVYIFLNYNV